MPDLTLSFVNPKVLDDCSFHPCVRYKKFESERIEKEDDENYKIYGNITIRGVRRKIILKAEFGGVVQDPWGNSRAGFSLTGKLNRSDFGLSFGLISDAGGVGLADEVKILANVQLVKQVEELV